MPNGTLTKYPDYYCSNPEQGFRIEARRKLRKGLRKADKEPTSEAIIALGRSLLDADVPFLDVSSYRIPKYLRGHSPSSYDELTQGRAPRAAYGYRRRGTKVHLIVSGETKRRALHPGTGEPAKQGRLAAPCKRFPVRRRGRATPNLDRHASRSNLEKSEIYLNRKSHRLGPVMATPDSASGDVKAPRDLALHPRHRSESAVVPRLAAAGKKKLHNGRRRSYWMLKCGTKWSCMNNSTFRKKSSTPSKSDRAERARNRIKALGEDPVGAQLARRDASRKTENSINYDGSSLESAPIETASVEKAVFLPVESVETTETADEVASRTNRKMISKLRRAFRKVGRPEVSEAEINAFLASLLEAKVPVLNRSSGRISRVVKGEKSIESLLLARVPTKSA